MMMIIIIIMMHNNKHVISDNGTIKRTDMSVIKPYIGAADDATALAIALGEGKRNGKYI